MGLLGQAAHPQVQQAIDEGIALVRAAGKAAGVLATDPALARHYLEIGARFVAVGVDVTLLVRAATQLAASFRAAPAPAAAAGSAY
jgi:4-hydroxy-2-oxoheptanedioate aldolase